MPAAAISYNCSPCSLFHPKVDSSRARNNEYLCQQCWQVLCGQPWPEEVDSSVRGGCHVQQQQVLQAQQAQVSLARVGSGPMSGVSGQAPPSLLLQQQQVLVVAAGHRAHNGAAGGMQGRRSLSHAELQAAQRGQGGIAIGGARHAGWQPSSMPEQPAILGSADDPRWGALAVSASGRHSGRHGMHTGGASAPAQPELLGAAVAQQQQQQQQQQAPTFSPLEMRNLLDEQSLELFESQSHLLDPEAREAVARQRQFLEWQARPGACLCSGWPMPAPHCKPLQLTSCPSTTSPCKQYAGQ